MSVIRMAVSAIILGLFILGLPVSEVRGQGAGLALRDYVAQILANHPALLAARADVDAAEARMRAAGQPLYNPELDLEYDNALDNGARVGVTQRFNVVGKRAARKAVGAAALKAAETRYRILRKQLTTNLLNALARFHAARERRDLASRRLALDEEFLTIAERRWREGDIPQASLLTARLALAEARASYSMAQLAFSEAREALQAITGPSDLPPPPLGPAPTEQVSDLTEEEIRRLPEVALARAETEAAQALWRVARKARVPDPAISFNLGRERGGLDPLGRRERTTAFGLGLSVPLPVRNSFRAEVDAARAGTLSAERNLANTLRLMQARVAESIRRYRLAVEAWHGWRQEGQVPLEEQRELLRRLWRTGDIGVPEFILQINQTFATEQAGIQVEEQLWTSWFGWLGTSSRVQAWLENGS
ncbi:MAG: hypothetical protein KatS3mg119_1928 [Rhodothalassiaceae bacterium]|nr:MAG: hypothetical protein KatS3mg119_1928 [Rhodothalassiaceae bacterium]